MEHFLCATCGTQYPESETPPEACPICEDLASFVPEAGQQWTTLDELRGSHRAEIREELPGLLGIGCKPGFAITQRLLLVPTDEGNVLWDCQALIDDEIVAAVGERGGLRAIAISHPHYYTTMVEWARAFGCLILIHEDDAEWVMRPDDSVRPWSGETYQVAPGITLPGWAATSRAARYSTGTAVGCSSRATSSR